VPVSSSELAKDAWMTQRGHGMKLFPSVVVPATCLCLTAHRGKAGTLSHKHCQLLVQDAGKVERAVRQLRHASSIRRVLRMIGRTFDGMMQRSARLRPKMDGVRHSRSSLFGSHGAVGLGQAC
jgi:hypothetical protein